MSKNTLYNANDTEGGALESKAVIRSIISEMHTATIVQVTAIHGGGTGAVGFVDVLPLVRQVDGKGRGFDNVTVYKLPYTRIQGGANAVIIDPQVGDLGIALFASRDISAVKRTKAMSNPKSRRMYDSSDGIYIGGILNAAPSQYIHFLEDGGIKAVSTGDFEVEAAGDIKLAAKGSIALDSPSSITLDTPSTVITGGLTAGSSNTRSRSSSNYTATFNIPVRFKQVATFDNDAVFSGISFLEHIHEDSIGGDTEPPKE